MSETLLKQQQLQQQIETHQEKVLQQEPAFQQEMQESEQIQQTALVDTMETHIQVNQPAEPIPEQVEQKAAAASKKPCFGHKHRHEPKAESVTRQKEPTAQVIAAQKKLHENAKFQTEFFTEEYLEQKYNELHEDLKHVTVRDKDEKAALKTVPKELEGEARVIRQLEIRKRFQERRLFLVDETIRLMPLDTKWRKDLAKRREKEGLRLDRLKRELKARSYPNPKQKKRELATLKRHDRFDFHKKTFRRENALSHQDAEHINPDGTKLLVNKGRAYFGGTKPMYIFEDQMSSKEYLYKEAVNCIGIYKPEGALVTEAAANLQKKLRGDLAIPAWAIRDENGKVLGSMQEKLEQKQEGRVDLFDWQINPGESELSDQMKSEVLKEHTLDWLLCNFDTKGENFLHRTDGHLSSFDKEASFSFLKDKGSEHMSATYRPHSNETIYNIMFQRFSNAELDLDLNAVREPMEIAMQIPKEEYVKMFADMLDHKYGKGTKKRAKMEKAILDRRDNLQEEYETFFTKLLEERKKHVKGDWREDPACKMLQEDGTFKFAPNP